MMPSWVTFEILMWAAIVGYVVGIFVACWVCGRFGLMNAFWSFLWPGFVIAGLGAIVALCVIAPFAWSYEFGKARHDKRNPPKPQVHTTLLTTRQVEAMARHGSFYDVD